MKNTLMPIIFQPRLIEKPWGGLIINDKRYGEEFLVSDISGLETLCLRDKKSIRDYIKQDADSFLGPQVVKDYGPSFPVYAKRLSAADNLSIQVHPNDKQAQDLGLGNYGKEEAWYILETSGDACLYLGVKEGVTKEQFTDLVVNKAPMEEYLNRIPVKAGEIYYIKAGLIHAIGKGVTLFEPQQSSNVTFRVYDWNRVDKQGNSRELHVDQSLITINFSPQLNNMEDLIAQRSKKELCTPFFSFYVRTIQTGKYTTPVQGAYQIYTA